MSPRILVVDGHPAKGPAVRSLLTWEGFQVVDLAVDGAAARRLAHELCADVVVLSLTRPLVRCFDTARELARAVPPVGVILLAFEDYLVEPAFQAGVRGYVLSSRLAEELATAIRTVGSGGRYLSPDIPAAYLVPGTDPAAEPSLSPDRVPAVGPAGS